MLRSIIPAWLVAVLTALWTIATALVESGVVQEGTWPYVVAAVVSAALAGVVGGRKSVAPKQDQGLKVDHLRTKMPEPRR